MTSAPDSVSWSWATSTSPGPTPASSKAAAAASLVGDGADSIGIDGLKTSKEPKRRGRDATDRSRIGVRGGGAAHFPRASTSATPPPPGEQNMYCVSGGVDHPGARP